MDEGISQSVRPSTNRHHVTRQRSAFRSNSLNKCTLFEHSPSFFAFLKNQLNTSFADQTKVFTGTNLLRGYVASVISKTFLPSSRICHIYTHVFGDGPARMVISFLCSGRGMNNLQKVAARALSRGSWSSRNSNRCAPSYSCYSDKRSSSNPVSEYTIVV